MPRIAPLPVEAVPELTGLLESSKTRMGFLPNSQLIMARRPEILGTSARNPARLCAARRRDQRTGFDD